jgi:hypothetical protein
MSLVVRLQAFATALSALTCVPATAAIAFVDVNVLPMDLQRVLQHQTVLVEGQRITAIGDARKISVPADAVQIKGDATKYLVPGLADMHTHIEEANDLALYTANGVTTVLQMGSPTYLDVNRMSFSPERRETTLIAPITRDPYEKCGLVSCSSQHIRRVRFEHS